MPAGKGYLAYADADVEYAPGRWLLRPREVGKLLQHLRPREGDKALAIAAPYAAAVLEQMGVQVTRLDADDLTVVPGANYDVIVCEGAVPRAPVSWTKALAQGGRLAVIERDGPVGRAVIYVQAEDGVGRRAVFDATPNAGRFLRRTGLCVLTTSSPETRTQRLREKSLTSGLWSLALQPII